MKKVKIFDFLCEIGTYTTISERIMEKAKHCKITTSNHAEFKEMVESWIEGAYDENPEDLAWEIVHINDFYYSE